MPLTPKNTAKSMHIRCTGIALYTYLPHRHWPLTFYVHFMQATMTMCGMTVKTACGMMDTTLACATSHRFAVCGAKCIQDPGSRTSKITGPAPHEQPHEGPH